MFFMLCKPGTKFKNGLDMQNGQPMLYHFPGRPKDEDWSCRRTGTILIKRRESAILIKCSEINRSIKWNTIGTKISNWVIDFNVKSYIQSKLSMHIFMKFFFLNNCSKLFGKVIKDKNEVFQFYLYNDISNQ